MQDKTITEKESLLIIQQMIHAAKSKMSDDGFMYLLWGWLVFAASIAEYALIQMDFTHHYLTWLLMPLGAVVSIVYGNRKTKTETVKTYVDEFMGYLWGAFVVALLLVLGFMAKLGLENSYPIILVLYGIATFVSGGALRFKPLIFGGVACWVLSVIALFVVFEIQLLLLALAVVAAYIVPGYLLRQQYVHGQVQGA